MKIALVTSDNSWFLSALQTLQAELIKAHHEVNLVLHAKDIPTGDIAFLLSFQSIVSPDVLQRNQHNLVVHASDLPQGRGWSPWVWQILEGKNIIPVCLLEAESSVDSGVIYLKDHLELEGHELLPEIRKKLTAVIVKLVLEFVAHYPAIIKKGTLQKGEPSFCAKRSKMDSQLNVEKTIKEQFNLLRVVDNEMYPAFFKLQGNCYKLTIEKCEEEKSS